MSAVLSDREDHSRVDTLRVPPHSIEAEQHVLGGILLVPEALASISDWLKPNDFYRREHRLIFETLLTMASKGEAIDVFTLAETMDADVTLEIVGGSAYLVEMANATPSAANITAYAEIILERSRLRQTISIGTDLAGKGFDHRSQSDQIVADGIRALMQIQSSHLRGGLKTARELSGSWLGDMNELYQRGEAITGLQTPWVELDRITHGLQDGDLIIVAGRPNMGKTVMGLQIAEHAAFDLRRYFAVFSLEMTASQLIKRMAASRRGIPHKWLMSPVGSEPNWNEVTQFHTELYNAPIMIDDTPWLTGEQICARARRAHLKRPLRGVLIDHTHRVKLLGKTSKDRQDELGTVAQMFKALAKELRCPVIALAQLNRGLTGRDDKHPQMSDLRESGALEQEGDVILFLHREDYYNKNTHLKGVVDVEIGKGRDIETGDRIHLQNRFDVMRLDDWEGELPLPPPKEEGSTGGFRKKRAPKQDRVSEAYAE